jgi:signal transduction histidine kinase
MMSWRRNDEDLAPIAYARSRLLAPSLSIGVAWYTLSHELLGLHMSSAAIAVNTVAIALLLALAVGCIFHLIPARHGHAVLTSVWWLVAAATLVSLVASQESELSRIVVIEALGASVFLHTRHTVISLLVFDAVYIPYLVWAQPPEWGAYLCAALAAEVIAVTLQLAFYGAIRNAEHGRAAESAALAVVRAKLDEIERSREGREALQRQLAVTRRMEATGTLGASFAHEMNNILAGITMLAAGQLRRDANPEYQTILDESQRGAMLTRSLLAFSRREPGARELVAFDRAVKDGCDIIARVLPRTVTLQFRLDAGELVRCDPVQVGQLVVNLALNGADAMTGTGTLTIEAETAALDETRAAALGLAPGRYARLCIADAGRGMDEATRSRAFDPFFTTKQLGKGCGLGLSTAWSIVRAHAGAIEIDSTPGAGTTVRAFFPVEQAR